jgi:transcriptional regulator with XRE-family HTH domain
VEGVEVMIALAIAFAAAALVGGLVWATSETAKPSPPQDDQPTADDDAEDDIARAPSPLTPRREDGPRHLRNMMLTIRISLRLTQAQFADALGVSRRTVARAEDDEEHAASLITAAIALSGRGYGPGKPRGVRLPRNVDARLLGANLAKRRIEFGLSGEVVAARAGVKPSQLAGYENGLYRPTTEAWRRLADALQLTSRTLLTSSTPPKSSKEPK